jgi:hypothetical protein
MQVYEVLAPQDEEAHGVDSSGNGPHDSRGGAMLTSGKLAMQPPHGGERAIQEPSVLPPPAPAPTLPK